jgi:hypothetical protein
MAKKKPVYMYGIVYSDLDNKSVNIEIFREKKNARKLAKLIATEALEFHHENGDSLSLIKNHDGFTIVNEDWDFVESWELITLQVQS